MLDRFLKAHILNRLPHLQPWVINVACVFLATLVRASLTPFIHTRLPFLTYFPCVMLSTAYGGWRQGVYASIASAILFTALFMDYDQPGAVIALSLVGFMLINALFISVTHTLLKLRERAETEKIEALHREEMATAELNARNLAEFEKQEQTEQLRAIVETAVDGIITIDQFGKVETVNSAVQRLFGYSSTEIIGQNISLLMPEPFRSGHNGYLERYLQTGEAKIIGIGREVRGRRKDGSEFPLQLSVSESRVHGRLFFTGIVRDIGQQKQAEEALRESEARLRLALDSAFMITFTWDIRSNRVMRHQSTSAQLPADPEVAATFEQVRELVYPEDRELFTQNVQAALVHPSGRYESEFRLAPRDDSIIWLYERGVVQFDEFGRPLRLIGLSQDITPRKIAEETLKRVNEQLEERVSARTLELRELQQQILEIAADEQRRIGHELHDGTGQELTGLTLIAGTLLDILDSIPTLEANGEAMRQLSEASFLRIRESTKRLCLKLAEANQHVHQLSHGIMPVQIDAEGLRSALEELTHSTHGMRGISCMFECSEKITVPDNTVATHLYRIAQEAVNNAIKHGKAREIRLNFEQESDRLLLEVRDDGIGIPAARQQIHRSRGMGLRIMEYRSSLIGGKLSLAENTPQGTLVRCELPLHSRNFTYTGEST